MVVYKDDGRALRLCGHLYRSKSAAKVLDKELSQWRNRPLKSYCCLRLCDSDCCGSAPGISHAYLPLKCKFACLAPKLSHQ